MTMYTSPTEEMNLEPVLNQDTGIHSIPELNPNFVLKMSSVPERNTSWSLQYSQIGTFIGGIFNNLFLSKQPYPGQVIFCLMQIVGEGWIPQPTMLLLLDLIFEGGLFKIFSFHPPPFSAPHHTLWINKYIFVLSFKIKKVKKFLNYRK